MRAPIFEYLTGAARVPAVAPEPWREQGLDRFYEHPNHPAWGARLCRALYHESVHFWQFLSSAYIANLVADEWQRLRTFERTGEIVPPSERLAGFEQGSPFTPYDLVECWARFWDVHTRNAVTIIKEDPEIDQSGRLEIQRADSELAAYSSVAYDRVMTQGRDCQLYAAPYRWMLERASGHSYLVALVFPIACHHAFGSPEPVRLFTRTFELATRDGSIRDEILSHQTRSINHDWLHAWTFIAGEVVHPVVSSSRLPSFTSGLDVIARSRTMADHPVFADYKERTAVLNGEARLLHHADPEGAAMGPVGRGPLGRLLRQLPITDPMVVFGLPGQPEYRRLLGSHMPVPRVRFDNFTRDAERPATMKLRELEATRTSQARTQVEETGEAVRMDCLEDRVRRFRAAEWAVSVGLAPDAFRRVGRTCTRVAQRAGATAA